MRDFTSNWKIVQYKITNTTFLPFTAVKNRLPTPTDDGGRSFPGRIELKRWNFHLPYTDMAAQGVLWSSAKKCFTAGLIGLTVSDRYASFMAVRGSSMSPTLNPNNKNSSGFVFGKSAILYIFLFLTFTVVSFFTWLSAR